jgi:hypothetical protein
LSAGQQRKPPTKESFAEDSAIGEEVLLEEECGGRLPVLEETMRPEPYERAADGRCMYHVQGCLAGLEIVQLYLERHIQEPGPRE